MSGPPQPPPRGAVAGVKADLAKQKEGFKSNPNGVGNAFTHNFLNQKPWHPLNFRNQIKKYEAEQKSISDQKAKEAGQAEFEAEQEAMKTLSYLSEAEQQRWRDRQSISFIYTKPPGLDAALAKEAAQAKAVDGAPAGTSATPVVGASGAALPRGKGKQELTPAQQQQLELLHQQQAERARELDRVREDPFAVMIQARMNLANSERFVLKHGQGLHGGFDKSNENQQLIGCDPPDTQHGPAANQQQEIAPGVVADADDLAMLASMEEHERSAVLRKLRKLQERQEREQQLEQAQAILKQAGYDISALSRQQSESSEKKAKKSKSKKRKNKKDKKKDEGGSKSKRHKREKGHNSDNSGSDNSSDSSRSH